MANNKKLDPAVVLKTMSESSRSSSLRAELTKQTAEYKRVADGPGEFVELFLIAQIVIGIPLGTLLLWGLSSLGVGVNGLGMVAVVCVITYWVVAIAWMFEKKERDVTRYLESIGYAEIEDAYLNPPDPAQPRGGYYDDDRRDEEGNRYWATGTYDPGRYYDAAGRYGWGYMSYIRDSYGSLDSYEANRPRTDTALRLCSPHGAPPAGPGRPSAQAAVTTCKRPSARHLLGPALGQLSLPADFPVPPGRGPADPPRTGGPGTPSSSGGWTASDGP